MVEFEGKYEMIKSENFVEYLRSLGQNLSEAAAKNLREGRTILTVEVEGEQQFRFSSKTINNNHVLGFTIGRPFQETFQGKTLDNIAKHEGNKITVTSTIKGKSYDRIYEFIDNAVIEVHQSSESEIVGKRYYKRI